MSAEQLPEIKVHVLESVKIMFTCECGIHNSYSVIGKDKPDFAICTCGKRFRAV